MYRDRQVAGRDLCQDLKDLNLENPLILAIPRGGVVVGNEVALETGADLDVVMAKKIGAPFNPEYAVAAVDAEGCITFPPGEARYAPEQYIRQQASELREEIESRLRTLRQGRPAWLVRGRDVVVVDDGLATGLTALAAVKYVRRQEPNRLVLAVPVGPRDTLEFLSEYVDHLICPLVPEPFYAVGQWYETFGQSSDETVKEILSSFRAQ